MTQKKTEFWYTACAADFVGNEEKVLRTKNKQEPRTLWTAQHQQREASWMKQGLSNKIQYKQNIINLKLMAQSHILDNMVIKPFKCYEISVEVDNSEDSEVHNKFVSLGETACSC